MAKVLKTQWLVAALALGLCAASWGQGTPQGYRLGAGDVLSVTVLEAPELNTNEAISEDGSLTLPKAAGRVQLLGLTVSQAEDTIKLRLERELRTATVKISVDETRASSVRLLGAVNSPGTRTIGPTTTLFELLTRADDLKSENAGVVNVRRSSSRGLFEQASIPLVSLIQGVEPRYNLPLRNGDVITIPAGERLTVYFATELSGSITFDSGEPKTLTRAISKGGGLTERSSGKIEIQRTHADGTLEVIRANYNRILNRRDPDVVLKPGDLIVVKRSII